MSGGKFLIVNWGRKVQPPVGGAIPQASGWSWMIVKASSAVAHQCTCKTSKSTRFHSSWLYFFSCEVSSWVGANISNRTLPLNYCLDSTRCWTVTQSCELKWTFAVCCFRSEHFISAGGKKWEKWGGGHCLGIIWQSAEHVGDRSLLYKFSTSVLALS